MPPTEAGAGAWRERVDSACAEMGYPEFVAGHLAELVAAVLDELGDEVRSVALFGSLGRGELSVGRLEGRPILLSDYELLVLTRREPAPEAKLRLSRAMNARARDWPQASPLSHVDLLVNSARKFRLKGLALRNLANFDTVRAHQVVYGEPLPSQVGGTPDPGRIEAADLVVERLWRQLDLWASLALRLAREGRRPPRGLGARERLVAGYYTNRNILELATVFCIATGRPRPSFRERVGVVNDEGAFSAGTREALDRALEAKLDPGTLSLSPDALTARARDLLEAYGEAMELLDDRGLFRRFDWYWTPRWRLRDWRFASHLPPHRRLGWSLRPKAWDAAGLLLGLNGVATHWLETGREGPESLLSELDEAWRALELPHPPGDGDGGWLEPGARVLGAWRGRHKEPTVRW